MTRETFSSLGARLAAELAILAVFYVVLRQQDAPTWAFTILVLVGTRASKLELHNGLGYLQQTLQRRRTDIEQPAVSEEQSAAAASMAEAMSTMQAIERPAADSKPPTPLKRHGIGRWSR